MKKLFLLTLVSLSLSANAQSYFVPEFAQYRPVVGTSRNQYSAENTVSAKAYYLENGEWQAIRVRIGVIRGELIIVERYSPRTGTNVSAYSKLREVSSYDRELSQYFTHYTDIPGYGRVYVDLD